MVVTQVYRKSRTHGITHLLSSHNNTLLAVTSSCKHFFLKTNNR